MTARDRSVGARPVHARQRQQPHDDHQQSHELVLGDPAQCVHRDRRHLRTGQQPNERNRRCDHRMADAGASRVGLRGRQPAEAPAGAVPSRSMASRPGMETGMGIDTGMGTAISIVSRGICARSRSYSAAATATSR